MKVIKVLFDRKLEEDPSSQIPSCFFFTAIIPKKNNEKKDCTRCVGGPLIAKLVKITWLTVDREYNYSSRGV